MGEFAEDLIAYSMIHESDREGEAFTELCDRAEQESYVFARQMACVLSDASLRSWFVRQDALERGEAAIREHYPTTGDYLGQAFHDIVRRTNSLSEKQRGVLIRAMALLISDSFISAAIANNQDAPRLDPFETQKEMDR